EATARARTDARGAELLAAAAAVWRAARGADCAVAAHPHRDTPMAGPVRVACEAALTERRAEALATGALFGDPAPAPAPAASGVAPSAPAAPVPSTAPAAAPRCPAGTEVAELWAGEYPGPVVEVLRPTPVRGRATPCDA
ncbi:MAG: hypothetical protein ACK4YP_19600, partial [Myxococcota bacterium]